MFPRAPRDRAKRASVMPLAFILLLAIAIIGVNVYQLNYVPKAGMEAEVESNRALLSDVREFDFAVREALATGQGQPVALGKPVHYPLAFPAPEDPTYIVATTENETIRVENYLCKSGDCQPTVNTTTVIFLGDYNYLKNDRVYGYEYGIVYSAPNSTPEGGTGVVTYNDQFMMDGTELTIVAFQGNFTYERRGTVHTTISPESVAVQEYTITDNGEAINITLPTELSEGRWRSMLNDELVSNGGHISNITYKNYTVVEEGGDSPGSAEQEHWESCDSSGQGKPFVTCTVDNSTNYVTLTLEPGENYTISTQVFGLSK